MKNILSKLKRSLSSHKKEGARFINPHKHWILLLQFFSIGVLTLIVFSVYVLYKIKNDQIFQTASVLLDNNKSIKEDLLKNVTESFKIKSKNETEIINNPSSYPDPSL